MRDAHHFVQQAFCQAHQFRPAFSSHEGDNIINMRYISVICASLWLPLFVEPHLRHPPSPTIVNHIELCMMDQGVFLNRKCESWPGVTLRGHNRSCSWRPLSSACARGLSILPARSWFLCRCQSRRRQSSSCCATPSVVSDCPKELMFWSAHCSGNVVEFSRGTSAVSAHSRLLLYSFSFNIVESADHGSMPSQSKERPRFVQPSAV